MKAKSINNPNLVEEKACNSAVENNINVKEELTSKNKINNVSHDATSPSKRRRLRRKEAKEKLQGEMEKLSKLDINGPNIVSFTDKLSPSILNPSPETNKISGIKPIVTDGSIIKNVGSSNIPHVPKKKRNKTLSFKLEDHLGVIVKKTKSNDVPITKNQDLGKIKLKNNKKNQIQVIEDKENTGELVTDSNIRTKDSEPGRNKRCQKTKQKTRQEILGLDHDMAVGDTITASVQTTAITKDATVKGSLSTDNENYVRKNRRVKKQKNQDTTEKEPVAAQKDKSLNDSPVAQTVKRKRNRNNKPTNQNVTKHEFVEPKTNVNAESEKSANDVNKKIKRQNKKKKIKPTDTETVTPTRIKKPKKPDFISEGIKNLNIGDNAHTLTDLLSGMAVARNTQNKKKVTDSISKAKAENSSHSVSEESRKGKSKTKKNWKKKRNLNAGIIVQNLPFSILLNYREILREHFSTFGTVQFVGIADLKCVDDKPKPIFTTRIFFTTEKMAEKAIIEDKCLFEGNIIRIKQFNLPVTRTYKPGTWAKKSARLHKMKTNQVKEENDVKDSCEK